jgi:hypothetical protein
MAEPRTKWASENRLFPTFLAVADNFSVTDTGFPVTDSLRQFTPI